MTSPKAYLSLWLGFLLIQFGASLFDHKDLTVEEAARATIVYHKKPGTPTNANCGDATCIFRKKYCAAYNMGDNLFVTSAHCLFGNDGTISEPDQLDVLGAGRTNVKIYRHQNQTIDIAWIKEETSKFGNEALDVSVRGTSDCITYLLKVHNPSTNDVHGGYQWTANYMGHPSMRNVPTSHRGTLTFKFQSTAEDDDLFLWCIDLETNKYALHYMLFGSTDNFTLLNDCHFSQCKKLPDEPVTLSPRVLKILAPESTANLSANPTTRSTQRTRKYHSATWAPWYPVVHRTVCRCSTTTMATVKQTDLKTTSKPGATTVLNPKSLVTSSSIGNSEKIQQAKIISECSES